MSEARVASNNPFTDPYVSEAIDRWENLDAECERIMMAAMRECKPIREDQKELLNEAGAKGLNKRAIRAHLKERKMDRKKEAIREKLNPEDQDSLDALRHALGELVDTPLGTAALHAAEAQGRA